MFSLFLEAIFCLEYQERRVTSETASEYFKGFEASRKGSNKKSLFGINVNTEIDGIQGIVEEIVSPYKKVNFTSVILDFYNQLAQQVNGSVEGGEPMPNIEKANIKKIALEHVLSFLVYSIPFIVVGVICIVIVVVRVIAQHCVGNFQKNNLLHTTCNVIFILSLICSFIAVIVILCGIVTVSGSVDTAFAFPDTFVEIQNDIMPYYSNTIEKFTDIKDLWTNFGKDTMNKLSSNITEIGSQLGEALGTLFACVSETGSTVVLYQQETLPAINLLSENLKKYEEFGSVSTLFDQMGFMTIITTISEYVETAMSFADTLLQYASVIAEMINNGNETVPIERQALSGEKHTFEPIKINYDLTKYEHIYNIVKVVIILIVVLFMVLCIIYAMSFFHVFSKFSNFVVRWTSIIPIIIIIMFTCVGAAFTVIGGIFAFYSDKGVESVCDGSINAIFDIFPERTLTIPSIELEHFTDGALENTIDIPSLIFKTLSIFANLVKVDSKEGLYKGLDLYKFFNPNEILQTVSKTLIDLSKEIKIPQSFHNIINEYYENIKANLPIDFNSLFEFKVDGAAKTDIIRNAVRSSTITEQEKTEFLNILNYIDNQTQLLYNEYNIINDVINGAINDIIHGIPDKLAEMASVTINRIGENIGTTSPILDESLNQIPISTATSVYNMFYNALFTDLVKASAEISSASVVGIISLTVMLIAIFFITKNVNQMDISDNNEVELNLV